MMYIVTTWEEYLQNVQNIGAFDSMDKAEQCLKELDFKETNERNRFDEQIWKSCDEYRIDLWASIQELDINDYFIPDSWTHYDEWDELDEEE